MDRTEKPAKERHKEEVELLHLDDTNQFDDSVYFTIDEAEWGDVPVPQLSPPTLPRNYNRYRYTLSVSEDGFSNAGFQDYHRQPSNTHSPFDSDKVFLFNRPGAQRFNVRKRLAALLCASCLSRIWKYLICSCTFDCSCKDQTGVHCVFRMKDKFLKKLKVLQGLLCLITIILSGLVFFPLGNITADFDGNCLLYSSLFINKIIRNNTVTLDLVRSTFGSVADCNFTTFTNVAVTVAGIFFIWFFIHTSYVSGLENSEMKLQLPVLLCYLILLATVIVSSFKITIGFNYWCYNIVNNNQLKFEGRRLECKEYELLKWSTDNRSSFFTSFVLAEISTWLLVLALVLLVSLTALRLFQNIKAAYNEIEVPHLKLEESRDSSEEEQAGNVFMDALSSVDCSAAPLPVYVVEYKNHQVLAKVVIHRDKKVNAFNLKDTLVLDTEKFKRNIGFLGTADLRLRGKVDFPIKMEPGQLKRRNWTGSCEELCSASKLERPVGKRRDVLFHEWHGFDTDLSYPVENSWSSHNSNWPGHNSAWPEVKGNTITVSKTSEWPGSNNASNGHAITSCSEMHAFENDFVGHHNKTSTSKVWQAFNTTGEAEPIGQFEWTGQGVETDTQMKDPWTFEQPGNPASEQSENIVRDEDSSRGREDCEASSEVHISIKQLNNENR